MLRSGRLTSRLLRTPTTSVLPSTRSAHEVAASQPTANDSPPPTPSPYNRDFTTTLSGPVQARSHKRKAKGEQRRSRKVERPAARSKNTLDNEGSPFGLLLDKLNETTTARIEELQAQQSPEVDDTAHRDHEGISGRLERRRLKETPPHQTLNDQSSDSIRGPQFWKMDWGEDKLKPSGTLEQSSSANVGPSTALRVVKGIVPSLQNLHIQDLLPPSEQRPVARLAHGLDRALFNPGVYWLKDPRSRVYNFNPYVEEVPDVREFDFSRVSGFIKSSHDGDLQSLAKTHGAKFAGSTSSLTGMLSQIYLALSRARDPNVSVLSEAFLHEQRSFSYAQRIPVSVVLWHRDGVYSTDSYSHSSDSDKNILTWMGTMLEKFLTLSEDDFKPLMRASPSILETDSRKEAYRYAKIGNYVTRAQLDCYDPRVPGSGIFDIKTRACLPIRKDIMNWEENSGYLLKHSHGLLESFEREYYDLVRAAFLKFSFQARIGNMDGMFMAYHNTDRIFGFQYIPLEEMDERLYGNSAVGPLVFEKCMQILEATMLEIVHHFPKQNIECIFEAVPSSEKLLVWASPLDWKGEKDAKPIVELAVTLRSLVDGKIVSGEHVADKLPHAPWTVKYSIAQSSASAAVLRTRAGEALERQRLPWRLPAGVGIQQMAELWEAMDFGGGDLRASKAVFEPRRFVKPGNEIRALRRVARRGRKETEEHEQQYAGEKKVVWGELVQERAEGHLSHRVQNHAQDD